MKIINYIKRTGGKVGGIYDYLQKGNQKELSKKAPLHHVVLNMVIRHLPNPLEAQKTRIPAVWKGDMGSPVGKSMFSVDEDGPVAFMVTKIIIDPPAGEVGAGGRGSS